MGTLKLAQTNQLDKGLELLFGGNMQTDKTDGVRSIPLSLIDDHPNQKRWSMNEDELNWLTNNIASVGVLEPLQLMLKPDGRYLALAGHRRKTAAGRAGLTEVPAVVRPYNEQQATIIFNATNLGQRQTLRPSEKAYAYKDLERAVGYGGRTTAAIAALTGDNLRMIQRYKRLLQLEPALLAMVDEGSIPATAGEKLASLERDEQTALLAVIEQCGRQKISLSQAAKLQKMSADRNGKMTQKDIRAVLSPSTAQPKDKEKPLPIYRSALRRYLPDQCSEAEALERILKALQFYEMQHGKN